MGFEADCGSSTVLEALRVTSTARPPCRENAGRSPLPLFFSALGVDGRAAFRIPNSEFRILDQAPCLKPQAPRPTTHAPRDISLTI